MRLWAAQVKAAIVAMRRAAGGLAQLEVATMQQVTTKRVLCGDRGERRCAVTYRRCENASSK